MVVRMRTTLRSMLDGRGCEPGRCLRSWTGDGITVEGEGVERLAAPGCGRLILVQEVEAAGSHNG